MHDRGDNAEEGPPPLPADEYAGTGTRIKAAMSSAEGLGVAALLMAVLSFSSSLPTRLFVWLALDLPGGAVAQNTAWLQATGHGVFAIVTLVLACTAIARTDVFTPSWVRGVAGGAAVAGIVGLIVTLLAAVLPHVT